MTVRLTSTEGGLIVAGAGLSVLAYPPFPLVVPAFLFLVPAALLIVDASLETRGPRKLLHLGFWYGTVTHGVLLHWLALAMWDYRPATIVLYPVAAVTFGGAYAAVFAVVGTIVRGSPSRLLVAFPAGIVALEWVAAQAGPVGFPWHQSALTLTTSPVLIQAADLAGSEGLGLVVVFVNAAVALGWRARSRPRVALARAGAAAVAVLSLTAYGAYRLNTLALTPGPVVAVVQPNATIREKWEPGPRDALVDRTLGMTDDVLRSSGAAFVAWPETALPDALRFHPAWAGRIIRLARRSHATVVAGGVDLDPASDGTTRRHNAAFAFSAAEPGPAAVHRKHKLVPLVERDVPGTPESLRAGSGAFEPGRELAVASARVGPYGTLLCYELTFPGMSRALRRRGAELLVTLSNDAWLGRTVAPHQAFAHAKLRAVETRLSVVRAANSGISGIVDPLGRVVIRTRTFVEATGTARLQRARRIPLAIYLGDWAGPAACVLLSLLVLLRDRCPGSTR